MQGPEWEQVTFGIKPASYDNGYSAQAGDRPDFFSDLRMRQAFSLCMDRQQIVDELLFGQSSVPAAYLPPGHPLVATDIAPLPFDPAQGSQLLDQVGWQDDDGNPATPRIAAAVAGIDDGTPLVVNYATSAATLRTRAAVILADSLSQCGIQVNVGEYAPEQLYAAGPDGILFGRKFDLAQFGWETGIVPPCNYVDSSQIPDADNYWLGTNLGGYSNPDYDAACRAASALRPEDPAYTSLHQQAQRIFAQDLPVVPLYYRLNMAVSRVDCCGLELDATARSALWGLEGFDFGAGCQ
jgi:peptide/nickel transport system substrate-binding protein